MVQYTATTKYHEFLSAVTQHAAEGILAYSKSGQIILANAAIGKLFGVDPKEVENRNIAEWLPEDADKDFILKHLFLASGKDKETVEFEIAQKTGEAVPVDVAVGHTVMSDGEDIFISNWRDITERREAHHQISQQAQVIDQMHDSVVVSDASHNVLFCNKAFEDLVRQPKEEILGKSLSELNVDGFPDAERRVNSRRVAVETGRWHGSFILSHDDGTQIQVDSVVIPTEYTKGADSNFIAVLRDVTDRMEAERRIQETQRIESLGRLAGGVAHDINNLLFPIFLNLEEAADSVEEGEDLEEAVSSIRTSMDACMKIKQMVEQILYFSRESSDKDETLVMSEVLEEAWKLTSMIVPSSQETELDIHPDCGVMTGNSVQISQILLNLVSNSIAALDHAPGTVSVSLQPMAGADISKPRFYAIRHEHYAVLSVKDTGMGIPEDIIGKIMDPFFTTKGVGEGTGLGLTEVAGIMREIDGAIDIKSEVDKGTTVTLYFPVTPKGLVEVA